VTQTEVKELKHLYTLLAKKKKDLKKQRKNLLDNWQETKNFMSKYAYTLRYLHAVKQMMKVLEA